MSHLALAHAVAGSLLTLAGACVLAAVALVGAHGDRNASPLVAEVILVRLVDGWDHVLSALLLWHIVIKGPKALPRAIYALAYVLEGVSDLALASHMTINSSAP